MKRIENNLSTNKNLLYQLKNYKNYSIPTFDKIYDPFGIILIHINLIHNFPNDFKCYVCCLDRTTDANQLRYACLQESNCDQCLLYSKTVLLNIPKIQYIIKLLRFKWLNKYHLKYGKD